MHCNVTRSAHKLTELVFSSFPLFVCMFEISETGPVGVFTFLSELFGDYFETAWAGTYEFDYAAAGVFAVEPLAHVEWGYVVVDKCREGV